MNAIVAADIIAVIAFGVATFYAACTKVTAPAVDRAVKGTLVGIAFAFFLVGISNTLEHAGITAFFDVYEDFVEVLFVPLAVGVVYIRVGAERLHAAQCAEEAMRVDHGLLTSIVETMPMGIVVADATGAVVFANDVAEGILAHATPGQIDLAGIVRAAPEMRSPEPVGEVGDMIHVAVRSVPLHPEGEASARAVVVMTDVSERVRSDEEAGQYRQALEHAIDLRTGELLEVNRQLQSASDVKQEFFTKMSHELRTPLNSIIGFSEIMLGGLSGSLSQDQTRQLGMIQSSGKQLLQLVNDVLDVSRIEAGYSPVSIAPVDVCARMGDLVASMNPVATMNEVDLRCECAEGPSVTTDPDRLDQIVRNLISNAVKFTDPGGRVEVTVSHDTDCTVIAVADSGIGIADEDQERIFDAFQQVETADRARPEGTGLGLVICRELAATLGCEMTVESSPGTGSVFTLTVPREFPGHLVIL